MESINGHSKACCNIPPIVSKCYQEKGKYETIGGLKVCRSPFPHSCSFLTKTDVTGPSTATKALVVIYDIFGFFPQTLQGADILATSNKEQKYQVFMPDFFEGTPADIAWYPPNTEEKKASLYAWFGPRGPSIAVSALPGVIRDVECVYGKKTWGAVGFCWGGKVVSLITGEGSLFRAGGQAHPGLFDTKDAEKITVPTLVIASGEEDAEEVKNWSEALKVEKSVQTWEEQIHGFMSARGNLEDEKCREAYEKGYKTFLEWFAKHL